MLKLQEKKQHPPRILIYAPPKFGKSTFGSMADSPVFQQTEDGLDAIDCPAFPLATSFKEVMDNLADLATQEHDRRTYVMDSLDWLEPLIWKQVAAQEGKQSIEDIGYGKGYAMALDLWQEYIDATNYLRTERAMTIINIAHAQVKRFENPETDAYDRYEVKMHKLAAAKMVEQSEIVLFGNYFVGIKKEDKAMKKDGRARAIGTGERILYTQERPAFIAGNRYGLPVEIPFDREGQFWNVIAQHVPFYKQSA